MCACAEMATGYAGYCGYVCEIWGDTNENDYESAGAGARKPQPRKAKGKRGRSLLGCAERRSRYVTVRDAQQGSRSRVGVCSLYSLL